MTSGDDAAGTIAVAFLLCSLPFLAQGGAIYPDGPAAAIAGAALLTLGRVEKGIAVAPLWLYLCGAALTVLPWLHIRLTWLAIVFALALVVAMRKRSHTAASYIALFAAPCVGAALFFASTYVMFETLDPTAPFRTKTTGSLAAVPSGAFGLLADVQYGLLPYAPAAVFALIGARRFVAITPIAALASSAALLGTLVISAAFVWWGGTTSPARFLVPVLPVVAIWIGTWWTKAQPDSRALCLMLLALSGFLSAAAAAADGGTYVVTDPDGRLTIFEWLNRLVMVSDALPSLFREGADMRRQVAIALTWTATALAILWLIRRLPTAETSIRLHIPASALAVVAWITIGCIAGWVLSEVKPGTSDRSQLVLLQAAPRPWLTTGWRNLQPAASTDEVVASLSFTASSARDASTLLHVPFAPAGRYQVELDPAGALVPPDTTLLLSVGRTEFAIMEWSPSSLSEGPVITIVMPVHSIHVRADAPDWPSDARVRLRVLDVSKSSVTVGASAERIVRSGDTFVYLLDQAVIADDGGFWLTGERTARVVLAAADGAVSQTTLEFEATDTVDVTLTRGDWQFKFSTNAGQRADARLPSSPSPEIVEIHVTGGDRRRRTLFVRAKSDGS